MTFKFLRIILILLLALTHFTITEETPEEAPETDASGEGAPEEGATEEEAVEEQPTCNEELLNSYGLLGMKFKEPMEMDICSNVEDSCCQLEDQLAIYDELTKGDELKLMEERFAYHKKVIRFENRFNQRFTKMSLHNSFEFLM